MLDESKKFSKFIRNFEKERKKELSILNYPQSEIEAREKKGLPLVEDFARIISDLQQIKKDQAKASIDFAYKLIKQNKIGNQEADKILKEMLNHLIQLSYNSKDIVLETWYNSKNNLSGKKLINKNEEEKILKELQNSEIVLEREKLKGIFSDSESESESDTDQIQIRAERQGLLVHLRATADEDIGGEFFRVQLQQLALEAYLRFLTKLG